MKVSSHCWQFQQHICTWSPHLGNSGPIPSRPYSPRPTSQLPPFFLAIHSHAEKREKNRKKKKKKQKGNPLQRRKEGPEKTEAVQGTDESFVQQAGKTTKPGGAQFGVQLSNLSLSTTQMDNICVEQ
jgi:hypothetical protein